MELSTDQLTEVLKSASPEGYRDVDHNLRRAVRVNLRTTISMSTCMDGRRQTPTLVMVRDISVRGIGFLFDRQLPAGQQMVVYLSKGTSKPLNMLCEVVHCKRTSDNNLYNIGAEFICPVGADLTPEKTLVSEAERIRNTMFS